MPNITTANANIAEITKAHVDAQDAKVLKMKAWNKSCLGIFVAIITFSASIWIHKAMIAHQEKKLASMKSRFTPPRPRTENRKQGKTQTGANGGDPKGQRKPAQPKHGVDTSSEATEAVRKARLVAESTEVTTHPSPAGRKQAAQDKTRSAFANQWMTPCAREVHKQSRQGPAEVAVTTMTGELDTLKQQQRTSGRRKASHHDPTQDPKSQVRRHRRGETPHLAMATEATRYARCCDALRGQIDSSNLVNMTGIDYNPKAFDHRMSFIQAEKAGKLKTPPPAIGTPGPDYIPICMVEHLMTSKAPTACAVKYLPPTERRKHGTAITNMEGAMHTMLVPAVKALAVGDYIFTGKHGYRHLPQGMARPIIMSALIHPDFEFDHLDAGLNQASVLAEACKIGNEEFIGKKLPRDFRVPTAKEKEDSTFRRNYDIKLKRHMVATLTQAGKLPAYNDALDQIVNVDKAADFLKEHIDNSSSKTLANFPKIFLHCKQKDITYTDQDGAQRTIKGKEYDISLEMLYNFVYRQLRSEFHTLDRMCPGKGYVYTMDPPAIFVKALPGGARLINQMHVIAIQQLISEGHIKKLKTYGFNDYLDKAMIPNLKIAFAGTGVEVTTKPDAVAKLKLGEALVVHNNSDGFGDNITNESGNGSIDAIFASMTTAARSLNQERDDLGSDVQTADLPSRSVRA